MEHPFLNTPPEPEDKPENLQSDDLLQLQLERHAEEVAAHPGHADLRYRYGVLLMKCAKPFGKVKEHGGYMLREEDSRKIVFGNKGYEFSATLEEVEEFLLAQPKYRDDEEP